MPNPTKAVRPEFVAQSLPGGDTLINLVSGSAANVGITLPRIVLGPGTATTSVSAFVEGLEALYWHSDTASPIDSVTQFTDYATKGWDVRVDFGATGKNGARGGAASAVWNKEKWRHTLYFLGAIDLRVEA